jgi:prepilin-type N-terminal cleavage/methylation domain-containing protein
MKRKNASASGFTLVEVMVAVVIIGVLVVGGASYLAGAARLRVTARAQQAATIEANSLMEWACQVARRSHYDAAPGYFDPEDNMSFSGMNPSAQWTFDENGYLESVRLDHAGHNIARITVTVSYFGGGTVTLTAYRYCEED